jgi:predicted MFS family arabinose efflux permease
MVSSLACGIVANKVGALRLVFSGTLISALSLLAMALISNGWLAAVLLLLMGVSAAAVWVCVVVSTREVIAKEHQGKSLGIMASTGTAAGVFLIGLFVPLLLSHWGWRSVWLVVGGFALATQIAGYIMLRGLRSGAGPAGPAPRERGPVPPGRSMIDYALTRTGLTLLFMSLLNGLTFIPFQTYLTSLLQGQFGWDGISAKACWSIIGVGCALGGIAFGYLSDRISAKLTLTLAYALLTVAMAGAQLGLSQPLLYSFILLFGLAYGAVFGQIAAYITKTHDAFGSAALSGATYVFFGLGSTIGNYAIGAYADIHQDFLGAYQLIAAGVAALTVLALVLPGDGRFLRNTAVAL